MTDETPDSPKEISEDKQLSGQEPASVLFNSSQTVEPVITHSEEDVSEASQDTPRLPDPLQTPEIAAPVPHPELVASTPIPVLPVTGKHKGPLLQIVFYGVLFVLGIAVGLGVRQILIKTPTVPVSSNTPTPTAGSTETLTPTPASSGWNTYTVLNGNTRQPITGVTFKLPPGVLPLACDGDACASQGTYLPGGTRFTVAARGEGQVLPDFRGAEIIDVGGTPFVTTQIGLGTRTAIAFRGEFPGTTIGGYTFSEMRGVMIPVATGWSLEVNHFSPRGVTTNFITDDALFDQIVQTVDIPVLQPATSAAQLPVIPEIPLSASGTATTTPTP